MEQRKLYRRLEKLVESTDDDYELLMAASGIYKEKCSLDWFTECYDIYKKKCTDKKEMD